jgi:hypothetical protein
MNGNEAGDGNWTNGTEDTPEDCPRERARRLAIRLRFLRMRERTADFENREAIRRERRRMEEELTELAESGGFEVDVS